MPIVDMPIFGDYQVQQFKQFCAADLANWTLRKNPQSKKQYAFYPDMGRKHVRILNNNILIFDNEPRAIYESVNYSYVFDGLKVYRYDTNFNRITLNVPNFTSQNTQIYFAYLVAPSYTLVVFTDEQGMWVHNENTGSTVKVTDSNILKNPTAIIAFGNRIAMTGKNQAEFRLSKINLGALSGANIDGSSCFTLSGGAIFAYETENIVNFAVLHNTLYIFLASTTSIWSNTPSVFGTIDGVIVQFPWRKNTSYNFDYGLSQPFAFDVAFGRLVWLGQNQDGLQQIVASTGGQPEPISTEAIDILLNRDAVADQLSPFQHSNTFGFLYQYNNVVFFRLNAGNYFNFGILDIQDSASSIQFNFSTSSWGRCIETNGERNRIQRHIYFANRHLVTVKDDNSIYEMSGQFFVNEIRNSDQSEPQAADAYLPQPFRYERVSPPIAEEDYGEFITDFVQIDFVWGDQTFINSDQPFENTIFIIDEDGKFLITEDGKEFIIAEDGNFPTLNEKTYYNWFKPHIELYYSDDGGISYITADVREFSQLGVYSWRMRWYQLGTSRNRVYKLICVSPSPIVVLGAIMDKRRSSGGAA